MNSRPKVKLSSPILTEESITKAMSTGSNWQAVEWEEAHKVDSIGYRDDWFTLADTYLLF